MSKNYSSTIIFALLAALLMIVPAVSALAIHTPSADSILHNTEPVILTTVNDDTGDFDPNVDICVSVDILKIRSFERTYRHPFTIIRTDQLSKPDLYAKVYINGEEFKSPIWKNTCYVYNQTWTATLNVPDDEEWVNITIQIWDWELGINHMMDISQQYYGTMKDQKELNIQYNIKTGHWVGDDFLSAEPTTFDPSGYGRASGCDDGSIYEDDNDCEVWFNVYQSDTDGDGMTYWAETEIFDTDPLVDDTGLDTDNDGVPIEWEYHWGYRYWQNWHTGEYTHYWAYDPFTWDDFSIDPDDDGLTHWEEYMVWGWGSDPFRQDLFLEMDHMEDSPDGIDLHLSERSKEIIRTAFERRNIVMHLDDGDLQDCTGPVPVESECDVFPFSDHTDYDTLRDYYLEYFLNNDEENWKQGVFHYTIVVYEADYQGFVWGAGVGPNICLQTSFGTLEDRKVFPHVQWRRDIVQASAFMHELGHTLGIFNENTPGCDDQEGRNPWEAHYWMWTPYMSCMNYRYTYFLVDYSDGSRGTNDFNDWDHTVDLTFFQRERAN